MTAIPTFGLISHHITSRTLLIPNLSLLSLLELVISYLSLNLIYLSTCRFSFLSCSGFDNKSSTKTPLEQWSRGNAWTTIHSLLLHAVTGQGWWHCPSDHTQRFTVLYCTVLYCTVLYCTVLYCTVLYCTLQYCPALFHPVLPYLIPLNTTYSIECSTRCYFSSFISQYLL